MIEKYLRSSYQILFLNPFSRIVLKIYPLSPHLITCIGCCLGVLSALFIALGSTWIALTLLLLSGFCDTLDGTFARLLKKTSPLGTALDIVSDRTVEAAIVIGLYAYAPDMRGGLALVMMASILLCITSFLIVGIFSENQTEKSFHYSPGLMERPEAFLFFACMILFPNHFTLLSSLFSFLVFLTAFIRLVQFANIWRGK